MKYVVNWIPLRIRVRSNNTQPHLNAKISQVSSVRSVDFNRPVTVDIDGRFDSTYWRTQSISTVGFDYTYGELRSIINRRKLIEIICDWFKRWHMCKVWNKPPFHHVPYRGFLGLMVSELKKKYRFMGYPTQCNRLLIWSKETPPRGWSLKGQERRKLYAKSITTSRADFAVIGVQLCSTITGLLVLEPFLI